MTIEINIYTSQGCISYVVKKTTDDFIEKILGALESGYAVVETVDGASLVINPMNAVAIDIRDVEYPPVS